MSKRFHISFLFAQKSSIVLRNNRSGGARLRRQSAHALHDRIGVVLRRRGYRIGTLSLAGLLALGRTVLILL